MCNINSMVTFECKICNYSTNYNSNFKKHKTTKKHRNKLDALEKNAMSEGLKSQKEPQKSQKEPQKSQKEPQDPKVSERYQQSAKMYKCKYCEDTFISFSSQRRHEIHRCRYNNDVILKLIDEKDKYIQKIEEEKKEMEKERKHLYKKIDELIDKVGNTYNHNIILNNYGSEDMSHITDQFKTQLLKVPYMMIPKMIEEVHFSDKRPENKNIALINKKENRLKVFKDNKWTYKNKKEVINELVDSKYYSLDNHFEKNKDCLESYHKVNYNQFKEYMHTDDKEFVDKLKEECENVLLNNR